MKHPMVLLQSRTIVPEAGTKALWSPVPAAGTGAYWCLWCPQRLLAL